MQEEIKIINIKIFVNPYTEPDEDEEKAKEEEMAAPINYDDDMHKVGSWFSNPATAATGNGARSGGVGKYLKAKIFAPESSESNHTGLDSSIKKRKLESSTEEYKNFSSW